MPGIGIAHYGQSIEFSVVFFQKLQTAHHPVKGRALALIDTVEVMEFPRAVNA